MKNHILDYWDSQANVYKDSYAASWNDKHAISLEINVISRYLMQKFNVLDVGCANGYSTFHHIKKVKSIVGVDFSAKMIEQAKKKRDSLGALNTQFLVGNVKSLPFKGNSFDLVYTTRTLINLATWDDQKHGINECLRVCKNGGKVIFSEAFWEPLALLNSMRLLTSLPLLKEHDFNRYLKKEYLENFLISNNLEFDVDDFSSIYYLGSRFLRELVTIPENYPGYSNPINEIFYEIEKNFSGGGFGIQQAYVIKKVGNENI